jgi:hypothetical protein
VCGGDQKKKIIETSEISIMHSGENHLPVPECSEDMRWNNVLWWWEGEMGVGLVALDKVVFCFLKIQRSDKR